MSGSLGRGQAFCDDSTNALTLKKMMIGGVVLSKCVLHHVMDEQLVHFLREFRNFLGGFHERPFKLSLVL